MTKKNPAPRRPKKANSSNPAGSRGPYNHSREYLEKKAQRQEAFLKALRVVNGRQLEACKIADVSIDTVLDWRAEEDGDFQKRFLKANQIVSIAALDEAIRRGIEGIDGRPILVPTYDENGRKSVEVRPIREYSDVLLSKVLSATDRRFRSGELEVEAGGDGKVVVKIIDFARENGNHPTA